jgi:periplasmic divalent cation tolerance protein
MVIAVYTTTGSLEEARRIAEAAVTARWCACAQIHEIESTFVWGGELQREQEWRLLLKCDDRAYAEVERIIRAHHSYEEPAIWSVRVDAGSPGYLRWVEGNSRG